MQISCSVLALSFVAALAACTSDPAVPSGETRTAAAAAIADEDDLAPFSLSGARSLGVTADGWRVTSAIHGYITGRALATNADLARIDAGLRIEPGTVVDLICFADAQMLGGYFVRFDEGRVVLYDGSSDGSRAELDAADVDLDAAVDASLRCEHVEHDAVVVTVEVTDGTGAGTVEMSVRDDTPDRRAGRVAVRVPGGDAVTVIDSLEFTTTAA